MIVVVAAHARACVEGGVYVCGGGGKGKGVRREGC